MIATMNDTLVGFLEEVASMARDAGVFGSVKVDGERLSCLAANAAAPAAYRLTAEGGRLWVSLVMADRWLSQSIEQDLVHTGDKIPDLVEEELVELGRTHTVTFEHFRSEDKLFTFRTPVPVGLDVCRQSGPARDEATKVALAFVLAYEAAFRNLGDMDASDEDE